MNPETGLPSYPDKFFDLAIVDPPYGIGEDGRNNHTRGVVTRFNGKKGKKLKAKDYRQHVRYDNQPPSRGYFTELFRVSKNQIIFGANHFMDRICRPSTCWIVWDKDNGECDQADAELAYTSFTTAVRVARFRWHGLLQQDMKYKEQRQHPNQKPKALYRWIVENYAKPGNLILDTHVGSASSLIAFEEMGFTYHAFENDQQTYADAVKRMKKGIQTNLFAHGTAAPQNQIEQPKLFE